MNKLSHALLKSRPAEPPLHRKISEELRGHIESGVLRAGEMLPSEHELMQRYGVSRGTVRQALAALRADGTIGGSQGRQLTVRGPRLTQPLTELISFSAWAQSMGRRPSGKVVSFERQSADVETAAALALTPGDLIHLLVRVRLIDAVPLMIERTAFPPRIGPLVAEVNLQEQSVYAELAQRGVTFISSRQTIDAMVADRVDATLLDVCPGTPLLRVRRQAFSLSGEPLEWSDDRYLAEKVNFTIEQSALASGLARRLE